MSLFSERDPWKDKTIYQVPLQAPGFESGVATRRGTTYTPASSGRKPNLPPIQPKQSIPPNQKTQNSSPAPSTGAETPSYTDQLNRLYNQIMNRGKFQYDLNGDMLYRQMADQYTQLGRQAMMDTMGQAATLTGGYGNSYGATAGNQAYQQYLTALNNSIPDLYDRALASWQNQGDELLNQYQLAAQHQATLDALNPKTVYVTKKAETSEDGTPEELTAVDPSYLGAVKSFMSGPIGSLVLPAGLHNYSGATIRNPLTDPDYYTKLLEENRKK